MTILPQLEHDLLQAARRYLPAGDAQDGTRDHARRRRPLSTGRWAGFRRWVATTARTVPMLLAVAVTVIIAAFALSLSHRGRQSVPATSAGGVQATRRQLIQMFGVLRRPQTKADLDPELNPSFVSFTSVPQQFARQHKRLPKGLERRIAQLGDPKLDRTLVRVVKIPGWHAKVGIETATWQPSRSSPQRSEGLDLELWIGTKPTIPPSSEDGTGPQLTSIDTIRTHGLAVADKARGQHLIDGVVLVPDGVARITVRLIRVIRAPVNIDPSQFGTATATVHDNIAPFQLAIPTVIPTGAGRNAVSGLFGTSAVAQTTWFDADGIVIKHTTTNLDVLIKVVGKKAFPRRPPGGARRHS
jgi:hypothetical protein